MLCTQWLKEQQKLISSCSGLMQIYKLYKEAPLSTAPLLLCTTRWFLSAVCSSSLVLSRFQFCLLPTSFLSCPLCGPFSLSIFCSCHHHWWPTVPGCSVEHGCFRSGALKKRRSGISFLTSWWSQPGRCPCHICCAAECRHCRPLRTFSRAAAEGCPAQKTSMRVC